MRPDELIRPWLDRLADELPRGLELFDAHTHTGFNDPDGYRSPPERLRADLEAVNARAVFFTMHEPDGYPAANDRVLEEAEAAGGRLVPFCRLDPHDDPLGEALRCLGAGARGIKLHPRAEGFTLDHPEVEGIFGLAHERMLPVLVHAGRGIPALGRHALELAGRFPDARVILAHAGICDLAWIWRHLAGRPNLFFDTAWWQAADLLALFSLVPPGQILLASDAPYASPALGAAVGLRCAVEAGLTAPQLDAVAGAQLARLVGGEEPIDVGPAPGIAGVGQRDILLERVHTSLGLAVYQSFRGGDATEALALARLGCDVGEGAPQAAVCASVLELLDRAEALRSALGPDAQPSAWLAPIVLAAVVARTPSAPLPPLGDRARVAERSP